MDCCRPTNKINRSINVAGMSPSPLKNQYKELKNQYLIFNGIICACFKKKTNHSKIVVKCCQVKSCPLILKDTSHLKVKIPDEHVFICIPDLMHLGLLLRLSRHLLRKCCRSALQYEALFDGPTSSVRKCVSFFK